MGRIFTGECPWDQSLRKGRERSGRGQRAKSSCSVGLMTDSASPREAQIQERVFRVVLSQAEMARPLCSSSDLSLDGSCPGSGWPGMSQLPATEENP